MSGRRRGVALLSGGLDSGVAAALWCEAGGELVAALQVDYGQRAAAPEARASRSLAARLGVPWRGIALDWLGDFARLAGSALVDGGGDLPRTEVARPGDAATAAAVWVPARNVVLIAAAASLAEAAGADAVVVGFNREEAATFADNSAEFAERMTAALRSGTRTAVRVESPTLDLDKPAIVREAIRLGFRRRDFWSCYRADGAPADCDCESCVRSRRAWTAVAGDPGA